MIDLWEMRNEEVHGTEEATIQQKRKEKVAITIRALHKLEEQARPSDSNLLYQDVEATIELTTAATLEAFISMKPEQSTTMYGNGPNGPRGKSNQS